jgi:hypothetical protein
MKKTLIAVALLAFGLSSQTSAANDNSSDQSQGSSKSPSTMQNDKMTVTIPAQGNQAGNTVQTNEQNKVMNQGENIQIQIQEQNAVQTKDKAKSKTKDNKGQFNAESHRSIVDTFVQSLLAVADRESGIGQEIKAIAQQQNDIKDRASNLISAVENRSKVKTFFIGTSYRNLGELRSQMVNSRNQIEQLKQLAEKAQNEGDKTELQNQIQALEKEQANINNFITQNESKFSLFGWAVKIFRK